MKSISAKADELLKHVIANIWPRSNTVGVKQLSVAHHVLISEQSLDEILLKLFGHVIRQKIVGSLWTPRDN